MRHLFPIFFITYLTACQMGAPDPSDTEAPKLTVTLNEQETDGAWTNYVVASSQGTAATDRVRFQCAGLNAAGRSYRFRDVSRLIFSQLNYSDEYLAVPESVAFFMRRNQMPNFTLIAEDDSGIKDIRIEVIEGGVYYGVDSGRNDSGMTVLVPRFVEPINELGTNISGQRRYIKVAQMTYDSPYVLQPVQIEIPRFTSELVTFTATDFIGNKSTTRAYWLPNAFCVDTRPGQS